MKHILRCFSFVRKPEDELARTRRTLESACRYVEQLEAVKKNQAERIQALTEERDGLRRHLSGGSR